MDSWPNDSDAKSPDCRSQNVIALIAVAFIVLIVVCLIVTGAK